MNKIFKWINVPPLPVPEGYSENIGVSNMLYGILDGKLVLGGGANFQEGHPLKNFPRIEHRDLYLIRAIDNSFKIVDQTLLEKPVADGKAIIFNNIMFYIGGSRIVKINVINNKLHVEEYAQLPFNIKNCIAHQYEGIIYYGLGTIDGKTTNRMFSFNIYTKENIELTPFPASERTQVVSEIFNDDIVVFSGGNSIAYTEGYKFNIKKKMWTTIANVEINNEKISILGAGSTKLNDYEMLVVGGFDEKIWNEVNKNLKNLTGNEKQKFRKFYFSQDLEYYNWNKKMLVYNYEKDEWRSLGEISFDAPCGNALVNTGVSIYSIMGEIKPGVRTPNIYRIPLQELLNAK